MQSRDEQNAEALAGLDRSGPPIKHRIRQLTDEAERRRLLRALRGEREAVVGETMDSGSLTWSSRLERKDAIGAGLDERVVEVPLAVECVDPATPGKVLDAGAALNLPSLRSRLSGDAALVHFTQSGRAEWVEFEDGTFSYMFGDMRELPFRKGCFDRVLCISTLEHIGMDNERYGGPSEDAPDTWRQAVKELLRVLRRAGTMMISVPFGRPRSLGWYRVFGPDDVEALTGSLGSLEVGTRYFACDGGWFDADPEEIARLDDEESVIRGVAVVRARGAA